VVRAISKRQARLIAAKELYGPCGVWEDKSTKCETLSSAGEKGVVLGSFNAG